MNMSKRWGVALLAGLLASVMLFSACDSNTPQEDSSTNNDVTESTPDTNDESTSEDESVFVDTGSYITSSELEAILPEYTYENSGMDANDSRNDGIHTTSRDVWADTWVVVDGADRIIATATESGTIYQYKFDLKTETGTFTVQETGAAGAPNDRDVGIFYFLWRERDKSEGINTLPAYDHHAAYMEGGTEKLWEVLQLGPIAYPHYWAEPYFGYYAANDEWVLRKHAYMFVEAGIDFVFFDTTNNNLHDLTYEALMKTWEEMRREGYETPKVAFLCGDFPEEFQNLWNRVYGPGRYEDLWYYWNGKPLLMRSGNRIMEEGMTKEQEEFFTHRRSWAGTDQPWYTSTDGKGCWPWSEDYPAAPGKSETGVIEQMCVMSGGGGMHGGNRSFINERIQLTLVEKHQELGDWNFGYALMDNETPMGLRFQQAFEHAIEANPPLITITGWNEWIAGKWEGGAATGQWQANEYHVSNDPNVKEYHHFIDQFNPEYSRDIEPMKGGFGDNYFYQMAEYIRLYKGARAQETAFGQRPIDLNGSVGQWFEVGPEYRDYVGDIAEREHPGHVGGTMYYNYTGRNDFVAAKVSNDANYLYFYAECADDITAAEGENWMNLFINSDCKDETGWYGYDFVLNRARDGEYVLIEKFVGQDTWAFETVGKAAYSVNGNVIQIKIAKSAIGFADTLDFKWADNSVTDGEIMKFMDLGDCAPNDRYSYRYTVAATEGNPLPSVLTNDMVVLKSRSYNAYVNGQSVRLVDDNTKAVLLASDNRIWLPAAFLTATFGIDVSGVETYDHYGVAYVEATQLLKDAGKVITVESNGLVVIADTAITDTNTLKVLYRSLA